MSDHHRKLFKTLGGELAGLIRSQVSKDPAERAEGAQRWEELTKQSERPSSEGFREDLRRILSGAVAKLEELQDDLERRDEKRPPS
jgi:hypothetical protein